jgi:hypothetical protein
MSNTTAGGIIRRRGFTAEEERRGEGREGICNIWVICEKQFYI